MEHVTAQSLKVPGSADTIELLDYMHGPKVFSNLFRASANGEVWRARPPGVGSDAWTEARIVGDAVIAVSWSGFEVRLDLATGKEQSRRFMK